MTADMPIILDDLRKREKTRHIYEKIRQMREEVTF